MAGSLLAGTDESPGEVYLYQGRSFKSYRGMGSVGAMARGSADRYFQAEVRDTLKLVPEGVEGQVPYKGSASAVLHQLAGGLKAAMGYTGSANLEEFRNRAKFVRISSASLRESHAHDVTITKRKPELRHDGVTVRFCLMAHDYLMRDLLDLLVFCKSRIFVCWGDLLRRRAQDGGQCCPLTVGLSPQCPLEATPLV